MNAVGLLAVSTGLAVVAVAVLIAELAQPRPSLEDAIGRVRAEERTWGADGRSGRIASLVLERAPRVRRVLPTDAQLRLAGTQLEVHVVNVLVAGFAGLVAPVPLAVFVGAVTGWSPPASAIAVLALAGSVLAPAVATAAVVDRAQRARTDARHQLSSYLDVVSMLLAANEGHEGALEQAAAAGDGRLFRELRRRMRETTTNGSSHVAALAAVGDELGLDELQQVAATVELSAAEGSPVARTLAARCATLRSTLAGEHESEARLRTSRLTAPLVGMALVFMALVIYPALSF